MNSNVNLIAFGTFGNPNGFRQTFFTGDNNLSKYIRTFDLKTDAIRLFPGTRLYAIRKECISDSNAISYAIYTFAKEPNSDRGGTFVGSSILFVNKVVSENFILSNLNEFHTNLVKRNTKNDTLIVTHSNDFSVSKPRDFDKLFVNSKDIPDINCKRYTNKNLLVYCELHPEKLTKIWQQATDLLNTYDVIYFTDSNEIAEFVHQKGLFKLVQANEFAQELVNQEQERSHSLKLAIDVLKKEKKVIEDDRVKLNESYLRHIEQNEKVHIENDRKIKDLKTELEKLNQSYTDFQKRIDDYCEQIKSISKIESVTKIFEENKLIFIESINQRKKPQFISSIAIPSIKSELRAHSTAQKTTHGRSGSLHKQNNNPLIRHNIFKWVSILLFCLWAGTVAYFLVFRNNDKANESNDNQTIILQQPPTIQSSLPQLKPEPNTELNANDLKSIHAKIKYHTTAQDIVKIILHFNPADIGCHYSNQSELYTIYLIEKNQACFEKQDSIYYFVKDTIRHIPAYKDLK